MKKLLAVMLLLFVATGCGKEETKNLEEMTCIEYIDSYMNDEGYTRVGYDGIFRNDELNLVWDASSNVFTYDEDQTYVLIYNNEIFQNENFEENKYDDLKSDYKFDELKKFSEDAYNELADCELKQINESYNEQMVKEKN